MHPSWRGCFSYEVKESEREMVLSTYNASSLAKGRAITAVVLTAASPRENIVPYFFSSFVRLFVCLFAFRCFDLVLVFCLTSNKKKYR